MAQDESAFAAMAGVLNLVGGNGSQVEKGFRDTFAALSSQEMYVGMVLQHTDEEMLTYFYIERGNDVMPKVLASFSPVDLGCDQVEQLTGNELSLGFDGQLIEGWDVFDLEDTCW